MKDFMKLWLKAIFVALKGLLWLALYAFIGFVIFKIASYLTFPWNGVFLLAVLFLIFTFIIALWSYSNNGILGEKHDEY